jgi:hypothetical protein
MTQDAENWELLQELFHLAETTPEADRERVLAEKCPDERLRRRALKIFTASSLEEPVKNRTRPRTRLWAPRSGRTALIRTWERAASARCTWWSGWPAERCSGRR